MEDKEFIDVNYIETDEVETTLPKYFTTGQVATILGVTDSTLRFWCRKFSPKLNIKKIGSHRRFTKENIKDLQYIKKLLKEDGLMISQAKEVFNKDENAIMEQVNEGEPLAIQALATAIGLEVEECLNEFKQELIEQQQEELKNIKSEISKTIQEENKKIFNAIDEKELEAKNRDIEMIDKLKYSMEEIKKSNQKKGFFARLFNR